MDKKNLLLGLAFILAAFGLMFYQSTQVEPPQPIPADEGTSPAVVEGESLEQFDEPTQAMPSETAGAGESDEGIFQPVQTEKVEESVVQDEEAEEIFRTLANEFIEVEFTNLGGAIHRIHFLQTKRGGPDDFVFNADASLPALGLSFQGPESSRSFLRPYRIVEEQTGPHQIVFQRALGAGIVVQRTFSISRPEDSEADPYLVSHTTELQNRSGQALQSGGGAYLNLGTINSTGVDKRGEFLSFGYYDGEETEFIPIRKFKGSSGFMGIGASSPQDSVAETLPRIEWGTVKNQFFAFVATVGSGLQSNGFFATDTMVHPGDIMEAPPVDALRASMIFPIGTIDAGGSQVMTIDFYAGPKEFRRLSALGDAQDEVMQFGFFGFFSKILLFFLYAVHSFVPSWGWSIVVMTIIIKLIFWPLTAKAAQSQKRMQKIQEPLKELREKYKDNPQKMQKETMRLFRENKVNPAAGCLPILIQMPIFIGLFWMLRTASELRYAPFLWIQDLSRPDTVAEIFGFPINILPLIMATTMFFQMKMTPAMASGDALQQKIFKLLPFVFLIFLYNFSSGLVLYWTVQNLLTILQQYITNKRSDVANEPVVVPATGKKKARKKAKK